MVAEELLFSVLLGDQEETNTAEFLCGAFVS